MEIGIDEIDDFDDFETQELTENNNQQEEEDLIDSLLKSRGIEDKSKIKFEGEEGDIEELNWDSLSNDDKLNIINSTNDSQDNDLDKSEVQLINAIRNSGMSPAEYISHIQEDGINNYIQNTSNNTYNYSVDQYTDDELFVADFISRMGNVTDEEAQEALENAKSNEVLFSKQIQAIRNEYKQIEDENIRQSQIEQEQQANMQFEQFASQIENQINNFTEFGGYDLNLDQQEMQDIYDLLTGTDAAGNNYFAKALTDPELLVQTAWFMLHGKQMIDDITDYFQKEIKQVRQKSYNKGLEDSKVKNNVVYRQKGKVQEEYNDLDDF